MPTSSGEVALLKIDVEGAELPVLQGARRLLAPPGAAAAVLLELSPALHPTGAGHRGAVTAALSRLAAAYSLHNVRARLTS